MLRPSFIAYQETSWGNLVEIAEGVLQYFYGYVYYMFLTFFFTWLYLYDFLKIEKQKQNFDTQAVIDRESRNFLEIPTLLSILAGMMLDWYLYHKSGDVQTVLNTALPQPFPSGIAEGTPGSRWFGRKLNQNFGRIQKNKNKISTGLKTCC